MNEESKKPVPPVPTARQLEFQEWEFGLFLHFGLRTFYEGYEDFDGRPMDPSAFEPSGLDCEQWARAAKEAGMNYAVLTAKHHDGFSNWPSKYSRFTVAASPWKEGKGDVVREFADACRKYGLKVGLYYSPYDGSADFYSQDAKAYDDYFVNQITELLGHYGKIDILWFDGCGSEEHEYDWPRIIAEIRRLQPDILIFNMGDPNFRWVGNEDGVAPVPLWNVADATDISILTGDKEKLGKQLWLPAECDVQMRANWFYSDGDLDRLKSLDELMGLYELSVGRGANLLLNIGPDREGLLPEPDSRRLREFGEEIRRRFGRPLAAMGEWTRRDERTWVYEAQETVLFDHVVLQENLAEGEKVRGFRLSIATAKSHRLVPVHHGMNIGHKAIVRIPAVRARGLVLEVTESDGTPELRDISVHYSGDLG